MSNNNLNVFLSGEIHTDWREEIIDQSKNQNLTINFFAPETNHANSDDCGVSILGPENDKFWHDYKGASINSINNSMYLNVLCSIIWYLIGGIVGSNISSFVVVNRQLNL